MDEKEEETEAKTEGSGVSQAATKRGPKSAVEDLSDNDKTFVSFPQRLMEVLEREELRDMIRWNAQGDAFGIIPEKFTVDFLQKYFQGTKFESFTRKLNRWGFKRIVDECFPNNAMVYRHDMFQRGKPVKNMKGSNKKEPNMREQQLSLEQLSRDLLTSPDVPPYLRKGKSSPSASSLHSSVSLSHDRMLPEVAVQQGQYQTSPGHGGSLLNTSLDLYNHPSRFPADPGLAYQQQQFDQFQATERHTMENQRLQEHERQTDAALAADYRLRWVQEEQDQLTRLSRSSQIPSSATGLGLPTRTLHSSSQMPPAAASMSPEILNSSIDLDLSSRIVPGSSEAYPRTVHSMPDDTGLSPSLTRGLSEAAMLRQQQSQLDQQHLLQHRLEQERLMQLYLLQDQQRRRSLQGGSRPPGGHIF
jgi:hypothetical protein